MGLFGKKTEGGLMDVIRCDEQEYLIWKWRPAGAELSGSNKENSIRFGSSLRVKDGEVAVFVYKQNNGTLQDFIEGPYDQIIKTENFPVLSSIIGLAYDGATPFQAEVYFINTSQIIQARFGVPYFDVFDPRFLDFAVPTSVRGTITFKITDYRSFIKLHRLINFDLDSFKAQIKDAVSNYIKDVVTNIPSNIGIPVLQLERKIREIGALVSTPLKERLESDFGVAVSGIDISSIEFDKESEGYLSLLKVTKEQTLKTTIAQTDVNIKNLQDTQNITAENMSETMRIQREEMQRAQRLQTESNYMGAHSLDQQTSVLKSAAEGLGQMGQINSGNGGINPAGMMTGMMMGGAMGQQMVGMMNQMGNTPPPPSPKVQYYLNVNGQNLGPYDISQLQLMAQSGQLSRDTYVWKIGMANWDLAGNTSELSSLFVIPPAPPVNL